ncbi:MAG: CvpA family protein [Bacteroidales bacterium]|jgi:membrane protein required for colicin V production|nr:CvpA family protein [Bacteroidales bacterium]NPV35965.1 CvpA family protein [Bacteroidales bacterium]
MEYNYLDIILAVVFVGFAIRGYLKGLILSLASLVGLIVGLYAAWHFSDFLAQELAPFLRLSEESLKIVSFILTFVLAMFIVYLIGILLEKVVKVAGLGFLNKLGGLFLGLIKGGLLISIIFYLFVLIGGPAWLNSSTLKGSFLYEPVSKLSSYVVSEMGELFNQKYQQPDTLPDKNNDQGIIL